MSQVTLRVGGAADAELIANIHAKAVTAIPADVFPTEQRAHWIKHKTAELYAEKIVEQNLQIVIAEQAGKAVGFALWQAHYLHEIFVDPAAQRQGVGQQLLAHVTSDTKAAGSVWLHTKALLNAVKFYEQQGFEAVSETQEEFFGQPYQAIIYQRFF